MLFDEIASGGMATVRFGRLIGEGGFSRTVAVKCLHAHFAKDEEFAAMFLDEARLAARIQHLNVVGTVDVVAREGELYLVMDYVHGESLSKLVRESRRRRTRIPVKIVTSIIIGALEGLHAAHIAKSELGVPLGIVHRDVSPQNVMVGVDGIARVLDFGIAKAAGRLQTTRDGQIKGKLAYIAPEQLKAEDVDRRTDVYSTSVMLWEALTGKRLFKADDEVGLFGMVLQGATQPPSALVPDLPKVLDEVTMRGLARDPADRFDTARDMAVALEQAVGFASAREVASWVENLASETLAVRAEKIAELESISSTSIKAMMAGGKPTAELGNLTSPAINLGIGAASVADRPVPIDEVESQASSARQLPPPRLPPRLRAPANSAADLASYVAPTEGLSSWQSSEEQVDPEHGSFEVNDSGLFGPSQFDPAQDNEMRGPMTSEPSASSLSNIGTLALDGLDNDLVGRQQSPLRMVWRIGAVALFGSIAIVGIVMLVASLLKDREPPLVAEDLDAGFGTGAGFVDAEVTIIVNPSEDNSNSTDASIEEQAATDAQDASGQDAPSTSTVKAGGFVQRPPYQVPTTSTSKPPQAPSTSKPPPTPPATTRTSSPTPSDCNPPFTIDSRGVRVPKRHCL